VHGAWNYNRQAVVTLFSFYKNIVLYIIEVTAFKKRGKRNDFHAFVVLFSFYLFLFYFIFVVLVCIFQWIFWTASL